MSEEAFDGLLEGILRETGDLFIEADHYAIKRTLKEVFELIYLANKASQYFWDKIKPYNCNSLTKMMHHFLMFGFTISNYDKKGSHSYFTEGIKGDNLGMQIFNFTAFSPTTVIKDNKQTEHPLNPLYRSSILYLTDMRTHTLDLLTVPTKKDYFLKPSTKYQRDYALDIIDFAYLLCRDNRKKRRVDALFEKTDDFKPFGMDLLGIESRGILGLSEEELIYLYKNDLSDLLSSRLNKTELKKSFALPKKQMVEYALQAGVQLGYFLCDLKEDENLDADQKRIVRQILWKLLNKINKISEEPVPLDDSPNSLHSQSINFTSDNNALVYLDPQQNDIRDICIFNLGSHDYAPFLYAMDHTTDLIPLKMIFEGRGFFNEFVSTEEKVLGALATMQVLNSKGSKGILLEALLMGDDFFEENERSMSEIYLASLQAGCEYAKLMGVETLYINANHSGTQKVPIDFVRYVKELTKKKARKLKLEKALCEECYDMDDYVYTGNFHYNDTWYEHNRGLKRKNPNINDCQGSTRCIKLDVSELESICSGKVQHNAD